MIKQKLKPSKELLKLKNVEVDISNVEPKYTKHNTSTKEVLPTVYYYNVELPISSIKDIEVESNNFLPKCSIVFDDIYGIMHDVGFPADNAKLTIILPTNHANMANIFMEFKIVDYHVELIRNSTARRIHMWGICNVENLLISDYKAYTDKSSYDLIFDIAKESGLGYMSNVDTSSDVMTWLNPGWDFSEFILDTIKKSWVGESSYVWSFVDFYYNINYIDLEKALNQDVSDIKWISTSAIDNKNNSTQSDISSSDKIVGPILTNDPGVKSSNSYFTAERIINQSTDISLKRGYLRNIHYYDVDGNWNEKAGSYKEYTLDTITTSANNSNTIFLKGDPGNLDFYKKNKSVINVGRLDTKNMHADMLWAIVQNQENMYDLQKITMQITLPTPNFNIKRYEKIKLIFVTENINATGTKKNLKLNGDWLVTGIDFKWSGSAFYQVLNIVKREITVDEI